VRRMKITKDKIEKEIEFNKECVEDSKIRGHRGSRLDFKDLAKCELLRGNIRKAQEYFRESDISWLEYLDHNKDYIKREWRDPYPYISCYTDRMLIIFFAYSYEKARDYVDSNLEMIEKYSEENVKGTNEEEYPGSSSDQIAYEKEILLHTYLMVKDTESALEVIKEIYDRFERSKCKTYKKGSYPTVLHAKLTATVVNGIIEEDKDLFLNGLKELSVLWDKLIDKSVVDYANLTMILYSEMARQIWPDLVVDSLHVPEQLKSSSYFKELEKLEGDEK